MSTTINGLSGSVSLTTTSQNPVTITSTGTVQSSGDPIDGNSAFAWTIINSGTISGTSGPSIGVTLTGGGYVDNTSGAHLSGGQGGITIDGAGATVVNDGRVSATDPVYLKTGGTVTNGSINNAASISGNTTYGHGVIIEGGAAAITNYADITAYYGIDVAAGGSIANTGTSLQIIGHTGIFIGGPDTTTVTNDGTISGLLPGVGHAQGMLIQGAVDITNNATGTITGTVYGILDGGGNGTITNMGKIVGDTGIYTSAFANENVTVINSGTIASSNGGAALRFGAGINRLIVDPGAVFVGTVGDFIGESSDTKMGRRAPPHLIYY